MSKKEASSKEIGVWWHGIAALPARRQDHAYHTLRRIWGDHTLAGARGFYRLGSEDHVTPAWFQNWALFPGTDWVSALVQEAGVSVGKVKRVRWAYACEEVIDARLRPYHKRDFVIPDIILVYEDEYGLGLVVFEVKRPGNFTRAEDDRKLRTYCDLPSTRRIARRHGCILVSERMSEKSSKACNGNWPVLTWERLRELQISAALGMSLPTDLAEHVVNWLSYHFARHGVNFTGTEMAPSPAGVAYGTEDGYQCIEGFPIPDSVKRFLKGSECVEAVWRGEQPAPVMPWLAEEPTAEIIRQRRWQTTEDRRVCRWSLDWTASRERTWR